ncbi:hypothetical protein TNCV_1615521 [Trichonephila clavipes]|nr:hypothetical protein TNCV_1615521 [Trichonephila clavipes]
MAVPQDLLDFYFTLIAGSNQKRKDNSKCMRQVKSYCEDVVYGVRNGKVKRSIFSQEQMPVRKAGVTNAKTSQSDINPLHWHHRQCSYDRFHRVQFAIQLQTP